MEVIKALTVIVEIKGDACKTLVQVIAGSEWLMENTRHAQSGHRALGWSVPQCRDPMGPSEAQVRWASGWGRPMKNRPNWTESQENSASSAAASLYPIFLVSGAWRVLRKHLLYDSVSPKPRSSAGVRGWPGASLGCVLPLRSAT